MASRVVIRAVDGDDLLGAVEIPSFGKLTREKPALLQKRAHSAVEEDYIIFQKFFDIHF